MYLLMVHFKKPWVVECSFYCDVLLTWHYRHCLWILWLGLPSLTFFFRLISPSLRSGDTTFFSVLWTIKYLFSYIMPQINGMIILNTFLRKKTLLNSHSTINTNGMAKSSISENNSTCFINKISFEKN